MRVLFWTFCIAFGLTIDYFLCAAKPRCVQFVNFIETSPWEWLTIIGLLILIHCLYKYDSKNISRDDYLD